MERDRWKLIDDLLQTALEQAPEDRADVLKQACGADQTLVDEVMSLLTAHRQAGDFLGDSIVEIAADTICDEAEQFLSESLVGQVVSHYQLLKLIGRGGMASVWLAERCDGLFERKVAIKFSHLAILEQASAERFRREGAILGKLSHPKIAELIDAGLTSIGEPFLVLEYVEGASIDEYCDGNNLTIRGRIRLFLDVLSAVAYAHVNLIVHRDIKPSNIVVSKEGQLKLLDFGIAKVLAGDGEASLLTLESGTMLTPRFAAPEQVTEGPITTATDIYALGVLLYLLLTGQHPTGAGPISPAQLVRRIADELPLRPSQAALLIRTEDAASRGTTAEKCSKQLRGDLDRIIEKALKKNPAERYPSASAFGDDLRRYLEHEPVLAQPDSFAYRSAKFLRRHRLAVSVAATACVALAAGIAGVVIQDFRVHAERDFAFRQLVRVQQHDKFLDFLLSDAAPSGKPFTVNDLLDRADRILEKEKSSPAKIDLLAWIGDDYASQDQEAKAKSVLEQAYKLSRQSTDPALRAAASCSLGLALARNEDLTRAEALIEEGIHALPNDPEYALDRVECLSQGAEVSEQSGRSEEGVHRMETAQAVLRASPFDTDEFEMSTSLDLASQYSVAGMDRQALSEFEHAGSLMSSLGRNETETAVVFYNNWALELDQVGRPVEAEKVYRRVIDISRDSSTEEAVSPMVLVNLARVQRELNHLPQSADYAERSYDKAMKTGDEVVVNQALLERARIYLGQHKLARAESMLAKVEPRLTKSLPPGHYAFAALSSTRGKIALERRELSAALGLMDQAIATVQAAIAAGGVGSFVLPDLYVDRSKAHLLSGQADQAEADARLALKALEPDTHSQAVSSKVGRAYLALASSLSMEGKSIDARSTAAQAFVQLQGSVGANHPDTLSAQSLAE